MILSTPIVIPAFSLFACNSFFNQVPGKSEAAKAQVQVKLAIDGALATSSLGPQIQAHAALGLPFTCPLKNAWPAEASSLASNPLKARRQRRRGRPRLSDGDGRRAFVYVLVLRCASWESSSQAEDGGNEMVTRQ